MRVVLTQDQRGTIIEFCETLDGLAEGLLHRSLGQRPRDRIAFEMLLAEGHIHLGGEYGLQPNKLWAFLVLGRCPRLR
jgi:hypothetical protein